MCITHNSTCQNTQMQQHAMYAICHVPNTATQNAPQINNAGGSCSLRAVAAVTYEGVFYVWDAASGTLLTSRQPSGPAGGAAIRFSPSGRYLVIGGWDAPIRWWGVP